VFKCYSSDALFKIAVIIIHQDYFYSSS